MNMTPAIQLQGLTKKFGALLATDAISLTFLNNQTHAIIGPNGAGKSTLINLITGDLVPDTGRILLAGEDITTLDVPSRCLSGLARSFQITELITGFTALQNVCLAVLGRLKKSFSFFTPADHDPALLEPALEALTQVGLARRAGDLVETLSHGEKRQLEIAMALALQPNILLLDEPMAGMGEDETRAMVALLQSLKRQYTIILVEHDMPAVFALADQITVLNAGRVLATGSPDAVRNDPAVQQAYLGGDL